MAIAMIPAAWIVGGLSILITYMATLLAKEPTASADGLLLSLDHAGANRPALHRPLPDGRILVAFVYRIIPTVKILSLRSPGRKRDFRVFRGNRQTAFTWYVANYTRYNVIFGSLKPL